MAASLTDTQVARYHRDGFLFPLEVFGEGETRAHREEFEALEQRYPAGSLPHDLGQYLRVNAQMVVPLAARIALKPAVLDIVESILGPDLLVWSAELFIKEPGTPKIVSWHQDLTYWGLGETDEELTAWIALSPASEASGCMRFLPGSHKRPIVAHRDTFAADNLLSRGQEIAVEVDEAEAVLAALGPGQMSLHHGRMFHASGPNLSDDRRIGLAIRYVTPGVRQIVGARDYAMLARGVDRARNWIHVAPPHELFGAAHLALYDQVLADQSVALAEGAAQPVGLYDFARTVTKA
ncbi:MAG: phytanoyl-CoA dioxygenase family protein [Rhodospirillales bacterium]|nr:phytanoyl-CoA dioxygenase family protein [Rhodospirillales bacterium]